MVAATKRVPSVIYSIIVMAVILLASAPGCEYLETATGPQVTRDEIRRQTQATEARREQYKKSRLQHPYAGKSTAQHEEIVNRIGSRILKESGSTMDVNFKVDKSEAVNAAASPGQIVVSTGMMRFVQSEDELAAVIGHEIAHLEKGHVTKTMIASAPVIIGSMAAEKIVPGSGRVVQMGGSIFVLKFSRDMEREADYYGILYAHNAGYDASAGINVWERFALELPESQQAGIFSSHPSSTERMIRARKIADGLKGKGKVDVSPAK